MVITHAKQKQVHMQICQIQRWMVFVRYQDRSPLDQRGGGLVLSGRDPVVRSKQANFVPSISSASQCWFAFGVAANVYLPAAC